MQIIQYVMIGFHLSIAGDSSSPKELSLLHIRKKLNINIGQVYSLGICNYSNSRNWLMEKRIVMNRLSLNVTVLNMKINVS